MSQTRAIVGALILAAIGIAGYFAYRHSLDPRQEAQRQWLELAQDPKRAYRGVENARVLMRCFKLGDSPENYDEILATGSKRVAFGYTYYDWSFRVKKPPTPDNTDFIVTVIVKGCPPVITDVYGQYTAD